jgi:hypothetical protein
MHPGKYSTSLHDQVRKCSKHRSDVLSTGFDRWSFNSYSKLGTKQGGYYPRFFKNNVCVDKMYMREYC